MAKIVTNFENFKALWEDVAFRVRVSPARYIVVTDYASAFVVTPIYSTRHLHYYYIKLPEKASEEKINEIMEFFKSNGFKVIYGTVLTVES